MRKKSFHIFRSLWQFYVKDFPKVIKDIEHTWGKMNYHKYDQIFCAVDPITCLHTWLLCHYFTHEIMIVQDQQPLNVCICMYIFYPVNHCHIFNLRLQILKNINIFLLFGIAQSIHKYWWILRNCCMYITRHQKIKDSEHLKSRWLNK